ncbi:MAG: hypothetical protein QXU32_12955 [Nitrososphaerales archaeon]
MSHMMYVQTHKGHDVLCERCSLVAVEFIDYAKALKDGRPNLYDRNKCNCTLPTDFYCNDCKERFSIKPILHDSR